MSTLHTVTLIAHTAIALLIIILVLLQRGKGADAGAAFGSGASGTVFGARGSSSFFSRATGILATAFFASSLTLAYISSQATDAPQSLIESAPVEEEGAAESAPEDDLPQIPRSGAEATGSEGQADDLPTLDVPVDEPGAAEQAPGEPESDGESQ